MNYKKIGFVFILLVICSMFVFAEDNQDTAIKEDSSSTNPGFFARIKAWFTGLGNDNSERAGWPTKYFNDINTGNHNIKNIRNNRADTDSEEVCCKKGNGQYVNTARRSCSGTVVKQNYCNTEDRTESRETNAQGLESCCEAVICVDNNNRETHCTQGLEECKRLSGIRDCRVVSCDDFSAVPSDICPEVYRDPTPSECCCEIPADRDGRIKIYAFVDWGTCSSECLDSHYCNDFLAGFICCNRGSGRYELTASDDCTRVADPHHCDAYSAEEICCRRAGNSYTTGPRSSCVGSEVDPGYCDASDARITEREEAIEMSMGSLHDCLESVCTITEVDSGEKPSVLRKVRYQCDNEDLPSDCTASFWPDNIRIGCSGRDRTDDIMRYCLRAAREDTVRRLGVDDDAPTTTDHGTSLDMVNRYCTLTEVDSDEEVTVYTLVCPDSFDLTGSCRLKYTLESATFEVSCDETDITARFNEALLRHMSGTEDIE